MIPSNLTCIWLIVLCIMWQLSRFCNLKHLFFLRISQTSTKSAQVNLHFLLSELKAFSQTLREYIFFPFCPYSLSPLIPACAPAVNQFVEGYLEVCNGQVFSSQSHLVTLNFHFYSSLTSQALFFPLFLHLTGMQHFICITEMLLRFIHRSDKNITDQSQTWLYFILKFEILYVY